MSTHLKAVSPRIRRMLDYNERENAKLAPMFKAARDSERGRLVQEVAQRVLTSLGRSENSGVSPL